MSYISIWKHINLYISLFWYTIKHNIGKLLPTDTFRRQLLGKVRDIFTQTEQMFVGVTERGKGGWTKWNVTFRAGTGCDEICAHGVGVYMSMCLCDGDRRPRAVGNRSARDHWAKHTNRFCLLLYTLKTHVNLLKVETLEFLKGYKMKNRFFQKQFRKMIQSEMWLWKHLHLITRISDIFGI